MTLRFLDAGFVIALELSEDQHHDDAHDHWSGLPGTSISFVTTSYVFDEVTTFFNSKRQHLKAVSVGADLLSATRIRLVHVDEDLFSQGWEYFKQHQDKTFSLTDCISFVLMERLGIIEALTFDKHFVQAGFTKLPS
jgi:predicted nucleic acid-binding protein